MGNKGLLRGPFAVAPDPDMDPKLAPAAMRWIRAPPYDPEGDAAASANQREYDQLHTTGSGVKLSSEALNR